MFGRLSAVCLLAWLFVATAAVAGRGSGGNDSEAEQYLRARLLAGQDVDFNDPKRCGQFEPTSIADLANATSCRTVRGTALAAMITDKRINDALPPHGLHVTGLVVKGEIDLRWVDIKANFICTKCLFGGAIKLSEATADHDLRFEGSELFAGLEGSAAQIKGRLSFVDHTTVRGGEVDLKFARISDALEVDQATFDAESLLEVRNATISHVVFRASNFNAGVDANDAEVTGAMTIDGGASFAGVGLRMKGATIDSFVKFDENVKIECLDLSSAHIKNNLVVDGQLDVGMTGVDITNTAIDGQFSLSNSVIKGEFKADGINISRGMIIQKMKYRSKLKLSRAVIGGDLTIEDSIISLLVAQRMHVGGSLYLRSDRIEDGGLDMRGTVAGADVEIRNTRINGKLEFNQVAVGKQLDFENGAETVGGADFVGMTVGGDFLIGNDPDRQLRPVLFDDKSDFGLAVVSSSMFVHNAIFEDAPQLVGTDIKGHFDTTSAKLPGLEMARATVGGDFRLAALGEPHKVTAWMPKAKLVLKNAHVGVIQDENEGPAGDPWPAAIDLEGFVFDRFGQNPRVEWVQTKWFDRTSFQPSPYIRLAKYYVDEGQKEQSDRILYAEKTKETVDAWRRCAEPNVSACAHAVGLTLLRVLIGYGIGNGLFQALIWVLVLTFVGMLVLRWTRDGGQWVRWGGPARGPLWCIGASINQLIPIVELNKEFKDYFDDSERQRFSSWQLRYFAAHAVMGYVLASFVVAAIAGLTQSH